MDDEDSFGWRFGRAFEAGDRVSLVCCRNRAGGEFRDERDKRWTGLAPGWNYTDCVGGWEYGLGGRALGSISSTATKQNKLKKSLASGPTPPLRGGPPPAPNMVETQEKYCSDFVS